VLLAISSGDGALDNWHLIAWKIASFLLIEGQLCEASFELCACIIIETGDHFGSCGLIELKPVILKSSCNCDSLASGEAGGV